MNLHSEYEFRCRENSDIVDHLPRLFDLACRYPGCQVIDLGVRHGNSTAAFLAAVEFVDGHVWSVDMHVPQVPTWWQGTGRWTFISGDDLNPAVYVDLPDVDIVFIDTSHHYEHTAAELDLYRHKARHLIVCHDTQLEQPDGAPPEPKFPVRKAICEFVETHGFTWTEYPECWGLGVIEVA